MIRDVEKIRRRLIGVVEDKSILEELVAINMLDFVVGTTSSCSGHVDYFGLLRETPTLRVRYKSNREDAQKFHEELKEIAVTIEGRKYYFRATYAEKEYLICFPFGIHPDQDLLIGPPVTEIPPDNPELGYSLIIPPLYNFEDPRKRNVEILEEFWDLMSKLLAKHHTSDIYQRRRFQHSYREDGTIESPFRKDKVYSLF